MRPGARADQTGLVRRLEAGDIASFVAGVLFDQERSQPVVAITTDPRRGCSLVDATRVADELRDLAAVVELETGDATWTLSELLPARLDVYGGAARIWWPGLTVASNPYDHRLYFVRSDDDGDRVGSQIVAAIRASIARAAGPATDREKPEPASLPPESTTVAAVSGGRIEVASAERSGWIVEADLPTNLIAECMVVGCRFDAQPLEPTPSGEWTYSIADLLPNTWEILAAEVRVGDVLLGRVQNIRPDKGLVFVDILPGAVGICHISELDYQRVDDIADYVQVDEVLPFRIIDMDVEDMRLELSRKRAYGEEPRPSPSLVPGGKPFAWRQGMPMFESLRRKRSDANSSRLRIIVRTPHPARPSKPNADEQIESLTAELTAARDEKSHLVAEIRNLRQQVQQLRKEVRAANDRCESLRKATDADPLSSERAFLRAVRVCHARMFEEGDRTSHPLRRMRVGPSFLRAVRELAGISTEKVIEVCAQVASGIANKMPAREVHQLRDGPRGAGGRARTADNAKAWRCSLQDNTASARRLHWWSIPGSDGGTIEFASVGLHDDFAIPE